METFVSFELAKKLKEKGFPQHWRDQHYILENEHEDDFFEVGSKYPVDIIYDYIPTIAAPTISQVLKWLREDKCLHIEFISTAYGYTYIVSDTPNKGGTDRVYSKYKGSNDAGAWDDYDECVSDAIECVIDNLI